MTTDALPLDGLLIWAVFSAWLVAMMVLRRGVLALVARWQRI